MGVFLQIALFPGCDESTARTAVEAAANNPGLRIDQKNCKYEQSYEGTQVMIESDTLGFALLARVLSDTSGNPVMLLYIYDGDFWGYDFYCGEKEDHFSTRPDYFGPVSQEEKKRLRGNPATLTGWFPTWDAGKLRRYLIHWSNRTDELGETACPNDRFSYGDCWQMTDFAAQLGFSWAFDQPQDAPPLRPILPTLGEILEQNLPPVSGEEGDHILLEKLPSALSPEYIRNLLEEEGVRDFAFAEKTPAAVIETVRLHRWSVSRPEADRLCQRLSVLAAFCAFWLEGDAAAWGFLHYATYEPLYGSYEKPSDVYVLRARTGLTDFTKRHRALKDLQRLIELDPANRGLYQAEINKWDTQERAWVERMEPHHQEFIRQCEEKKRQEAEKDARRLELILAKRRKKKP